VPVLLKSFYYAKDQELAELSLQMLFKCYSQRKILIRSLKEFQILSDKEDLVLHEYLTEKSKTLKFLVEKTEIWVPISAIVLARC
jgi:hypothetical protein